MDSKLKSLYDRLNSIEIKFEYGSGSPLSGKKLYIYAFFIPVMILFISYMIIGVYPAGDRSVLTFNMRNQYINYYEHFRDAFRGRGSLFNSWSRNLTGETIGLFAYYLSSPFTLIAVLLPRSVITESILIMQLLKAGTSSVTFCCYLRHSRHTYDNTSLIFSILYSLMAYMIVQMMNIMWIDGLIYLPLICLGIEKLVDAGKCLPFIVPLTLMFMANFYIGWMLTIFSCFYFVIYYCFISESCRSLKVYAIFPRGLKFAFGGILSAICAAWLLIPVYYSLSLGKMDYSAPDYSIITQFDFIDLFVNFLPNTYDTVLEGGSPILFCGVLTLILIPLYFFNEDIALRSRAGYGVLAAFICISMYSYGADVIWHGFQAPRGTPYRYAFILSFLLLVMAAQSFDRIDKISCTKLGCVFFLLLGYLFYIDKQDITVTAGGRNIEKTDLFAAIWFAALMVIIYVSLMYFHKKYYRIKPVPLIVTFCIIAEVTLTSSYTLYEIGESLNYDKRDTYYDYVNTGRDTVSRIRDMDDGVYRMEKLYVRSHNDPLGFGYYGVSHTSSTLNSDAINFLRSLGFTYIENYIGYRGATYVTDAVLGIKYVMDVEEILSEEEALKKEKQSEFEKKMEQNAAVLSGTYYDREESWHYDNLVLTNEGKERNMYVYENPYALPIGFMADSSVADVSFATWENPFENQNMLLSALLSDEAQDFFVRIDIDDISMDNVKRNIYDAHDRYETLNGGGGNVDFTFTAPGNEMIYMFFPSDYERTIRLFINGEIYARYYGEDYMKILALGRFEPGEKVTVTASVLEEEVMFKEKYFCYLDEEKFAAAIDKLKQHPLEIESFKEDHIKGKVTAEKDGILFTSITYEPGWSIYVDGAKTESVKLADALIGIPVTEGQHTVEMKFFPRGLAAGIVLSVFGIVAVVFIGLYEHKKYAVKKEA